MEGRAGWAAAAAPSTEPKPPARRPVPPPLGHRHRHLVIVMTVSAQNPRIQQSMARACVAWGCRCHVVQARDRGIETSLPWRQRPCAPCRGAPGGTGSGQAEHPGAAGPGGSGWVSRKRAVNRPAEVRPSSVQGADSPARSASSAGGKGRGRCTQTARRRTWHGSLCVARPCGRALIPPWQAARQRCCCGCRRHARSTVPPAPHGWAQSHAAQPRRTRQRLVRT